MSIADDLRDLMLVPGLSGHEGRVRAAIRARLPVEGTTDRMGNLVATLPGDDGLPTVMLFTHMDQLGFVVRAVTEDGFLALERLGGVPERALAAQPVLVCGERDVAGIVAVKSHHATGPDEKYRVTPYRELHVDIGARSRAEVAASGVRVGDPVVYEPAHRTLAGGRVAGTSVDDRAGCAVLLDCARRLATVGRRPTIHIVFAVQEEFNLRGAVVAAEALRPDVAIQIDLLLTGDTPDMDGVSDVRLGGGPGISLYSFHGRGTLNGLIPHPALPPLFERAANAAGVPLQRSAQTGVLTETSYVQLVGGGVACIDVGFPCRHTHSANEMCDLADLEALADLLVTALPMIDADFTLDRDAYV